VTMANEKIQDFRGLVMQRQSVRKYSGQTVAREKIQKCIEAARLAPSACNAQPWKFIVIDDPDVKDRVAGETCGPLRSFNKFVPRAPVIIALIIERSPVVPSLGSKIKAKPYHYIDMGIAAEHICLQAAELGLGTCMLGWFNEKKIKAILKIPKKREIGLLITLGYPESAYRQRKKIRKAMEEVMFFNAYDEKK
ncbi:MAG: nitroreductase family protein, partial [Bacteroidales bacterium]